MLLLWGLKLIHAETFFFLGAANKRTKEKNAEHTHGSPVELLLPFTGFFICLLLIICGTISELEEAS